jgi:indolepyruvate ferredoxin oxidoreductase alpha subunit
MNRILKEDVGARILALGNEAIVRGAIEAGCDVASSYPGTPSSEIGGVLSRIAEELDIYFEYSVNEKVALELAAAASVSGLSALTFMKHVGLNVASDTLVSLAYVGVRGAHVIVSADDPGCHSSQSEQDNRWYARLANIPMLEPSSPQEAKDMMVAAFELSRKLELPVLLRTTTRIVHTRAPIVLGEIKKGRGKSVFEKDQERFMLVPAYALKDHAILIEKMKKAEDFCEHSGFNYIQNNDSPEKLGVISSGVSFDYCVDVLSAMGLHFKTLKLGFTHPMPRRLCADFLRSIDSVIVTEELDPFLEEGIKSIAGEFNIPVTIYGKGSGHFPEVGEFNPDIVMEGIASIVKEHFPQLKINEEEIQVADLEQLSLPVRPPVLCAGCPHRATAYAAKQAASESAIFPMDIGCYTLVLEEPLTTADIVLCMGSSIGTACGFSRATDQQVLAFMGDSTFFHAGIPGLINAVHTGSDFVLSILDNATTAMTGFQPHPGNRVDSIGHKAKAVDIVEVVKGCGVESIISVDPYVLEKTIEAYKTALEHKGVSVIVARHACALVELRVKKRKGEPVIPYEVDREICIQCYTCTSKFGCPASFMGEDGSPGINATQCVGCGVCAAACPSGAIKPVTGGGK